MTRLVVALCALTLAGCGSTAKTSAPPIDPRAEYQNSLDALTGQRDFDVLCALCS